MTCLHADTGDAGGGIEGQQGLHGEWRKILRGLVAFGKFIGGTSKIYDTIY